MPIDSVENVPNLGSPLEDIVFKPLFWCQRKYAPSMLWISPGE